MELRTLLEAVLLGIVEGLTEFLPISSTGHLILVDDLLGFSGPPGHVFEIVIQLGAILAVCWHFRERLTNAVAGVLSRPEEYRFARNLLIAFLPSVVIGALAHGFIKSVLFSPWVVAVTLILGGIAIIAIERAAPKPRHTAIEAFSPLLALKIGLCQVVSMIPGVSRAGATIMGAMMLGVERSTATVFSFFLAIPTMLAATVYDLYKSRGVLDANDGLIIAVGFVTAFLSALVVVRWLIGFVAHNDFRPFAWYRIVLGTVMLALLALR